MILDAVDTKGPIDGVLLHLHGAMVSDSHEDAEGELLARLRRRLGPEVPVVVTLDLHANVTQRMADNANALIAYRTYPHIDQYERAWQGAELLERAMQGEIRPQTVIARRPMIYGLDHGRTQQGPMAELIARGEALEQSGEALVGQHLRRLQPRQYPRCRPVGDGHRRRQHAARARQSPKNSWTTPGQTRDFTTVKLLPVAEAVALARQGKPGDKPLVVADYTDNPGGGGYGDATAFLKGLVEAGVESVAFHAICDPEAVQAGMRAGVGDEDDADPRRQDRPARWAAAPLALTGEVVCLTNGRFIAYGPMGGGVERDYGPSMVFRVGGIDIIVITNNGQATDLGQFTSLGIDPTRYRTVAVKSMQHFRAAFEPIAREVVLVDTGALCSEIYTPSSSPRSAARSGRSTRFPIRAPCSRAFISPAYRPCAGRPDEST